MDAGTIIGVIGVTAALVTTVSTALKLRRDARRDDLTTASELYTKTSAELLRRVEELERCHDDRAGLEARLTAAEASERVCNERLSRLEAFLPFILAEEQALDYDTFGWLLDNASDGWVISSTAGEGTWLYVNERLLREFRMTLAEVLSRGWRRMIHPDDLPDTATVEARSWNEKVTVVNRYVGNGVVVTLRWFARYRKGQCLALARIVSTEEVGA